MKKINFSNGSSSPWFSADEAENAIIFAKENGISFNSIACVMEDDLREAVHFDLAPCSEAEFLSEYLRRADADLIIG